MRLVLSVNNRRAAPKCSISMLRVLCPFALNKDLLRNETKRHGVTNCAVYCVSEASQVSLKQRQNTAPYTTTGDGRDVPIVSFS